VIPYIVPEMVEALKPRQSAPEPVPPILPKRSAARQNASKPISFPHVLAILRHSDALVAVMRQFILWHW
jgi:hypothetical protein